MILSPLGEKLVVLVCLSLEIAQGQCDTLKETQRGNRPSMKDGSECPCYSMAIAVEDPIFETDLFFL